MTNKINWINKLIYGNKLIANTNKCRADSRDFVSVDNEDYHEHALIAHTVPIRNQGSIGSCASHAAVRAIEIQLNLKNKFLEGSELFHYYMVRKYITKTFPEDTGQTIRQSMKCLQDYGICIETAWPYNTKNINKEPNNMSASIAQTIGKWANIGSYYRLTTVADIKRKLNKNIPVVFGLKIDTNYVNMKNKYNWTPGGTSKGGHAQIIVGYDENYFYIENSWGTSWGSKGTYRAKISDIMKYGFDFFTIDVLE